MRAAHNRYRRNLARERDAAAVYRALASRRAGEARASLLALARAEERHARHWASLLGEDGEDEPVRFGWRARLLAWLARRVSSLLVLSVVQRAELDGSYDADKEATAQMAADERVHARVVEGLARQRRARASGLLRASLFGINDGLVSNVSLVLGMAGAGGNRAVVLLAGLTGLLAGALSMAAGEYVSVRSQRELLAVSPRTDDAFTLAALRDMPREEAEVFALALRRSPDDDSHHVVGTAAGAASSSFSSFALGALVPVLPFVLTTGRTALLWSIALTGIALFTAGTTVGVLTGGPLLRRGARQLLIGAGAAAVTYGLGALLGVTVS